MIDFDLDLIGSNDVKILHQLRRATRARYRYIHLSNAQDVKPDPAVEHQLMNHVQLIETLAQLANVDQNQIVEAVRLGVADARDEA